MPTFDLGVESDATPTLVRRNSLLRQLQDVIVEEPLRKGLGVYG